MSIKLAIIALVLALTALGVSAFATFEAVNQNDTPTPMAESQWSEEECADARGTLGKIGIRCPTSLEGCTAYSEFFQAIAANCP
jgi:hypothetical protein